MFNPETIVVYRPPLVISRLDGFDYSSAPVPRSVRLNPLRYTITLFPGPKRWTINDGAKWFRRLDRFTWWLWRRRAWERRQATRC